MHPSTLMALGLMSSDAITKKHVHLKQVDPFKKLDERSGIVGMTKEQRRIAAENRLRLREDIKALLLEGFNNRKEIYQMLLEQGKIPKTVAGTELTFATCGLDFAVAVRSIPRKQTKKSLITADYLAGCHDRDELAKRHNASRKTVYGTIRKIIRERNIQTVKKPRRRTKTDAIVADFKNGERDLKKLASRHNVGKRYVRSRLICYGLLDQWEVVKESNYR